MDSTIRPALEADARGVSDRMRGYATLDLYTHALMSENIAWYERRGYRVTARLAEKGFDRVYMSKSL